MPSPQNTIEVDPQTAEILRRMSQQAKANGQTLGTYLLHKFPSDAIDNPRPISQKEAWEGFVNGMVAWTKSHLPPGYQADDSRNRNAE